MYVHRPSRHDGKWVIIITKDRSIFSEKIEIIDCGLSRENAWQTYRWVIKNK